MDKLDIQPYSDPAGKVLNLLEEKINEIVDFINNQKADLEYDNFRKQSDYLRALHRNSPTINDETDSTKTNSQ